MDKVSASTVAMQKAALLGSEYGSSADPRRKGGQRRFPAANSLMTAVALSCSAGYVDGFTYIGHGHVFASAMTGNMVLLGIHIAALKGDSLKYALPMAAYVMGVLAAHIMLRDGVRRYLPVAPHVLTLLLEIVVLLSLAYAPLHFDDAVLVALITICTSIQNTSFRNIGTRTYNSVFMTGNLQAFSNALAAGTYPLDKAKLIEARDLGAVLSSFLGGAAVGALATARLGSEAVVLPAALLSIGMLLLLVARDDRAARPGDERIDVGRIGERRS